MVSWLYETGNFRTNEEGAILGFAHTTSGQTLYATLRNTRGQIWQSLSYQWLNYVTATFTADYNSIVLTEQGAASAYYTFQLPQVTELMGTPLPGTGHAEVNVKLLSVDVFVRAGANPAENDAHVDQRWIWVEYNAGDDIRLWRPRSLNDETVDVRFRWTPNVINGNSFPGLQRILALLEGLQRR